MISRYDNPAQQPVYDTYVPIPYQELAYGLRNKQNEYDVLKNTADQADNAIAALKAPSFIRTSTDYSPTGTIENPQAMLLKQAQEQFAQQKQDLLESGLDFTTPEGKQKISQYVRNASNFYNTHGRQIQQDSQNIEQHNKNFDEYLKKGVGYQGNAYYADSNVDKFLNNGAGFEVTSLNPYQERNKIVGDALDKIKSQVITTRDKNGLVSLTDKETGQRLATIQNGRTIWEGVSKQRVLDALKGVVGTELEGGIQNEAKSYMEYLLGKNSDKVYDENGKIKRVEYETKDSKGNKIKLSEDADKYYYNKKYSQLNKDLEDYALNTFVSSKVNDTQTNKLLPDDYQLGKENIAGGIPTTVTGYANVEQNSSSTPAKDAYNSFREKTKQNPVVTHNYGGGTVVGGYDKMPYKEKLKDFKSTVISSFNDPNDRKKAEVLLNQIANDMPRGHLETDKEIINQIADDFDSRWKNVKADKLVNFVPTKNTAQVEKAFTNFVKNTAAGSIVSTPNGEETDFDPDSDYTFSGIIVGDNGVSFNMRNTKNPKDVIKVYNRSNIGANNIGVARNDLKQIDNAGHVQDNPLLRNLVSAVYGDKGSNYTYKVVTDPDSPSLSSVVLLNSDGRIIESIPDEVLDNLTLESVAASMGSVGLGAAPKHKLK
jgi:hypothetical protein